MTLFGWPWKRKPKLSKSERRAIYLQWIRLQDERARAAKHRRTVRDIDEALRAATVAQLSAEMGVAL